MVHWLAPIFLKVWHDFSNCLENDVMEMRNEKGSEKRRRKIVQKNAVLVRSVRANQSSTLIWEKENTAVHQIWKN